MKTNIFLCIVFITLNVVNILAIFVGFQNNDVYDFSIYQTMYKDFQHSSITKL